MNRREIALKILCAKLVNRDPKEKHYSLYVKDAFKLADEFLKYQDENIGPRYTDDHVL